MGRRSIIRSASKLPLRWSWLHACLAVQWNAKQFTLVVNGQKMIEEVVAAPENLLKPENLSGKLILGKAQLWPKLWVKNWGLYANLNIFSKVMSIEQITEIMSGENCGSSSGDYLSWGESEWSLLGGVTQSDVEEEDLCRGESKIHVFDQNVAKTRDCQRLCFNQHKRGRMASVESVDAFEQLVGKQNEIQAVKPEQTWWVGVSGSSPSPSSLSSSLSSPSSSLSSSSSPSSSLSSPSSSSSSSSSSGGSECQGKVDGWMDGRQVDGSTPSQGILFRISSGNLAIPNPTRR